MAEISNTGIADADLAEAVASPSSISADGLSQTNRSIQDLIAADKYLRKRSLLSRGRNPLALMVTQVVASGPIG